MNINRINFWFSFALVIVVFACYLSDKNLNISKDALFYTKFVIRLYFLLVGLLATSTLEIFFPNSKFLNIFSIGIKNLTLLLGLSVGFLQLSTFTDRGFLNYIQRIDTTVVYWIIYVIFPFSMLFNLNNSIWNNLRNRIVTIILIILISLFANYKVIKSEYYSNTLPETMTSDPVLELIKEDMTGIIRPARRIGFQNIQR